MQAAHRDFLFPLEIGGMCRFWSQEHFGRVFTDPRHLENFSLQINDFQTYPLGLTHTVSKSILSEELDPDFLLSAVTYTYSQCRSWPGAGSKITKENETPEQVDSLLTLRLHQHSSSSRANRFIQPVVQVRVNLPWPSAAKPPSHYRRSEHLFSLHQGFKMVSRGTLRQMCNFSSQQVFFQEYLILQEARGSCAHHGTQGRSYLLGWGICLFWSNSQWRYIHKGSLL